MSIEVHANSFGAALHWLRKGKKVWRAPWLKDDGYKLEYRLNSGCCPISPSDGSNEVYEPDQEDILALDWHHN